ncbi:MAG: alpha/beta hydrolase [Clostridiales bacterium]|nr:alpha/beta hydrolase [Clostridiales bacterium]
MKKTILKLSAASLGVLAGINQYIDSYVTKTNYHQKLKCYNWEQGDIYYSVNGDGQPLLLIHDLSVFSSENDWTEVAKNLFKTSKVYTLDLIGCGKSDKPAITYTNYLYVQLIRDFIKNVIQEQTNIVASGRSCSFILMADSLNPGLISNVFMINPPTISSLKKQSDKHSKVIKTLFGLPIIGRTCYYIATNRTNTEYYLSEKCFYNPFHMKQYHVKAAYQASHGQKGKGKYLFASLEGNYLNVDITDALRNRTAKTVIIIGNQENGADEIIVSYERINKNIIIRTINNTKHLPQLEAPEDVCTIIKNEIAETETFNNNNQPEQEPYAV